MPSGVRPTHHNGLQRRPHRYSPGLLPDSDYNQIHYSHETVDDSSAKPVIWDANPSARKVSLVLLFGLSLVLVGITLYRVVAVIDRHSEQQFRSLLASLEILAAAAVSNALVLGSFVRDRGAKKQRFRMGSAAGSSSLDRAAGTRRGNLTARHWGSDADLVGDIGIRLQEGLSADERVGPRRAPMAIPLASQANNLTPGVDNENWAFQQQSSLETDEIDAKEGGKDVDNASQSKKNPPRRRLSFFDVGGLLDDNSVALPPCYRASTWQSPGSSSPWTEADEFTVHRNRQGSNALLQDIGGLLTSEPAAPTRRQQSSVKDSSRREKGVMKSKAAEKNRAPSLNDAGGLLS